MEIFKPSDTTIVHSVDVDFIRREITIPIHVVQYDNNVPILAVSCYLDGKAWTTFPDDTIFSIRFGKPDNTFVYNVAAGKDEFENNLIYFRITQQMTTIPGKIKAVIEASIDGEVAASSYVLFDIDYNPVQEGMIESTDEYTTILESVADAQVAANNAKTKADEALLAANEAVGKASQAGTFAEEARLNAEKAEDSARNASDYETQAQDFADSAIRAEANAKISETNAKTSETNSKNSEIHIEQLIENIDKKYTLSSYSSNVFYDTDRCNKVLVSLRLEDTDYHMWFTETSGANAWINFPVCPISDLEDGQIYTGSFLAITDATGMAIQLGYCDRYGNNRSMGDNGPSTTNFENRFTTTITIDASEHADDYLCLWVYAAWSPDNASSPHTAGDIRSVTEIQIEKGDGFTYYRPRGMSNIEIVPWNRKKYVAVGDSITYGMIGRNVPGTGNQLDSFAKLTAEHYNMLFTNLGKSGYDVYRAYTENLHDDIDDDADVITIMFGTNDVQTLSLDNFRHYYSEFLESVYLKFHFDDNNNPVNNPPKIIIIIPPKILGQDSASIAQTSAGKGTLIDFKQYEQAIRDVASDYSFPVCDFYNECGLNPHLFCTLYGHAKDESVTGYFNKFVPDGIHPSQIGHKMLADRLIAFFKTLK